MTLEFEKLVGGYQDTSIIKGVSAHIAPGEILGVFGRNGVGKTTLARLAQGGLTPFSGDIRFNGKSTRGKAPFQLQRLGLSYMPQVSMVFDELTVSENLEIGRRYDAAIPYFDRFPRLRERLDQPAGTMSGGERKILGFVRTLAEGTKLLVLDEPSEGVQQENIEHMAECLKERADQGCNVMLVEQNMSFLMSVAHQYLGLDTGRCALAGGAGDIDHNQLRSVLAL